MRMGQRTCCTAECRKTGSGWERTHKSVKLAPQGGWRCIPLSVQQPVGGCMLASAPASAPRRTHHLQRPPRCRWRLQCAEQVLLLAAGHYKLATRMAGDMGNPQQLKALPAMMLEHPSCKRSPQHTCCHGCKVLLCSGRAVGGTCALVLPLLSLLPLEGHTVPAGRRVRDAQVQPGWQPAKHDGSVGGRAGAVVCMQL